MRYLEGLLFILIAAEIILTASLVYSSFSGSSFCIIGQGCSTVQKSSYAQIFGINVSLLGLIAFILLFIAYALAYYKKIPSHFFLSLSSIGALFAIYFIYIQTVILKQLCANCIVVDSITIIIFIISSYDFLKNRKSAFSSSAE